MLRDNQLKQKEKLTAYDEGSFLPPCKGYFSINDLITLIITSAGRRVKSYTGKDALLHKHSRTKDCTEMWGQKPRG